MTETAGPTRRTAKDADAAPPPKTLDKFIGQRGALVQLALRKSAK